MKTYYVTTNKTSDVINELKKLGYKMISDPHLYDENIGANLSSIIKANKLIALIRRTNTVEICSPRLIDDAPKSFHQLKSSPSGPSTEKNLSRRVLENLLRGNITNIPLLSELHQEAQDVLEDNITAEEIILMEKEKCTDG